MPSAAHEITTELSDEEMVARMNDTLYGQHANAGSVNRQLVAAHYGIDLEAAHSAEAMVYDEDDDVPVSTYRWYDPLPNAADEYIRFAQTPFERVYLGIEEFDNVMRGLAPRELLLIVGFAHSGKTVLTTEFLLSNRRKRIAFFTPDETRVLVLIKLVSIVHGISAEELEERIFKEDAAAIELVRSTARDHFPNLAVFEETLGIQQMHRALDEAEHAWGAKADAVVFDYADLLEGYDEPKGAISALKSFGKARNVPMIVLHQSSRTSGKDGQQVTLTSGGFGGEQQATFLIGVRRKKNELMAQIMDLKQRIKTSSKDTSYLAELKEEAEHEHTQHQNTVTFNLVKNKRPPSRLVDEVDFILDQETGAIRQLERGELAQNLSNRFVQEEAF